MRRWKAVAACVPLLFAGAAATATPYSYHTYDSMVTELASLAAQYPALAQHFTAQDAWGLPTIPDGADELEIHVLRISKAAPGEHLPAVLLVGTQHGNEIVSVEACLALARFLLESYGSNAWLTDLVDRREILLVPMANPWGHNHDVRSSPGGEGFEDMNRDHPYDRDCVFCDDEVTLSTVGALAVHELAKRHLVRVMIDYHGGVEMIMHSWGSPLHTGNTEAPDETVLNGLGQRMRIFGGPYSGFYPVGTANDLLGPVNGPLDDTSYATGWDSANSDPAWPNDGWGALGYTVEISDDKSPPQSQLGGDADLLTPGGLEDGYVPKNVRIGLAAIDVAEPWVAWTNRASVPTEVAVDEPVSVDWQVRGCFDVDDTRVRFGTDPDPLNQFDGQTASQSQTSGDPCFETPVGFSAQLSFDQPGVYWLTPAATVDSALLAQGNPNPPGVAPQAWVVRGRTEDGVVATSSFDPTNQVIGQTWWGAEPLAITVSGGGGGISCADMASFRARCNAAGTVQARLVLNTESHDGATLTLSLDGSDRQVTIQRRLASFQEPGAGSGPHTVVLEDPAGCFPPRPVTCP